MVLGEGDVVGLVVDREPAAAEPAVIEQDLLGDAAAERLGHEVADDADVAGEQVEVVDAPDRRAAAVEALGDVLQRRPFLGRRHVAPRLVVEFEDVAVGVFEAIGRPVPVVALGPAEPAAHRLDDGDAPGQRLGRRGAIADMADAGRRRARQLQRMVFVVVPAAQVGRILVAAAFGEAVDPDEEVEALLEAVGQQLDVPQMGDVKTRFGHGCSSRFLARAIAGVFSVPACDPPASPEATIGRAGPGVQSAGISSTLSVPTKFATNLVAGGCRSRTACRPARPAAIHHHDAVGDRQRLFLVVRDEDGGDAEFALDRADLVAQRHAHLGVERRQRLVEQQQLGLGRQRAGQRHALLLAAGQLVGIAVAEPAA
jgi:hypothetical protein